MRANEIRGACEASPFLPFNLRLADGRSLPVPHPEFVALAPRGRTAIVFKPDGSFNIVDVMLVTDIEIPTPTSPNGANGNGASS